MELKEKVVVYWSERFYKREYHEHKSFLDFLENGEIIESSKLLVSCLVHIHNNCPICGHLRRHRQSP